MLDGDVAIGGEDHTCSVKGNRCGFMSIKRLARPGNARKSGSYLDRGVNSYRRAGGGGGGAERSLTGTDCWGWGGGWVGTNNQPDA
jgi:hypothetical protein